MSAIRAVSPSKSKFQKSPEKPRTSAESITLQTSSFEIKSSKSQNIIPSQLKNVTPSIVNQSNDVNSHLQTTTKTKRSRKSSEKLEKEVFDKNFDLEETVQLTTTLAGGQFAKCPVVFTKDSRYFFCAVATHIKVYSVATGQTVKTLSSQGKTAHSDAITTIQLNPTNHLQLYSGSLDGTIRLWDINDGILLKKWNLKYPITHVKIDLSSPNYAFVGYKPISKLQPEKSSHRTIKRYNLEASTFEGNMLELQDCTGLELSKDGNFVIVSGLNKLAVLDRSQYPQIWKLNTFDSAITSIVIHPNDHYVAIGDKVGKITLWYGLGQKSEKFVSSTMHWHAHRVNHLAFTNDGVYLLSGGEESVLVIWQLQTQRKNFLPRLGGSEITSIAISSDQSLFAVSLSDSSIQLISSINMEVTQKISGLKLASLHPKSSKLSKKFVVEPRNQYVVMSGYPGTLQFYNTRSDMNVYDLEVCIRNRVSRLEDKDISEPHIEHFEFSMDGKWLATVDVRVDENFDSEINLKFWKYNENKQSYFINTQVDKPHKGQIIAVKSRPRHNHAPMFVTLSEDGEVKIWRQRTEQNIKEYWSNRSTHTYKGMQATDAAFSSDGSLLAISYGPFITIWDPQTSTVQGVLTFSPERIEKIFFAPDAPYLIAITVGHLHMWNLLSCSVEWSLKAEVQLVTADPSSSNFILLVKKHITEVWSINFASPIPTEIWKLNNEFLDFALQMSINPTLKTEILLLTKNYELQSIGAEIVIVDDEKFDIEKDDLPKSFFNSIYAPSSFETQKVSSSSSLPSISTSNSKPLSIAPSHALPPPSKLYMSFMNLILQPPPRLPEPESEYQSVLNQLTFIEPIQNEKKLIDVSRVSENEIDESIEYFQILFLDDLSISQKPNGVSHVNGVSHINGISNANGINYMDVDGDEDSKPKEKSAHKMTPKTNGLCEQLQSPKKSETSKQKKQKAPNLAKKEKRNFEL
ncbi:WD repeat-containing protein 75 [Nowakowskiella sp. JEL0078]|nr:WD repeat-containing protein 75 [Nowakowskiella sp. JEL0078]